MASRLVEVVDWMPLRCGWQGRAECQCLGFGLWLQPLASTMIRMAAQAYSLSRFPVRTSFRFYGIPCLYTQPKGIDMGIVRLVPDRYSA